MKYYAFKCSLLTSGVKRNLIPSTEPFSVSPLIRKMVSTKYGKVEVMYTAWGERTGRSHGEGSLISHLRPGVLSCMATRGRTLPVVSMPRIQQTYSTVQAHTRHRTIHHCRPPESSMAAVVLSVSLYQK